MPNNAFYTNPFFWALLSMMGMAAGTSIFSKHRFRHSKIFVGTALTLIIAGRLILMLPFCPQPRFEAGLWRWIVGGALLLAAALAFAGPVLQVRWWSPPKEGMKLITTGIYGLVRHPIYLGEVLWPLGLAIIMRSTYGVALTPVWWAAFLIHALAEEAELERALGEEYRGYMKKVPGRIFPWLPV
jgi:protein-S-isoprenylcysteine O-methyltransferase Ste14